LVSGAFCHVHPASRWRFKCWSSAKNAELIDRLAAEGLQVVITAAPDPEEVAFVDEIRARIRSAPLNLAGQLSIKELGALTARAKLFIGVDSMPMHLAAAMGTPTVALFGPSGESVWGPVNVAHRVVQSGHSCRPCGLGRLRRRQGERLHRVAPGRRGSRGSEGAAGEVKLAIVRQRYNPYGGAERIISRALPYVEKKGAAVTLITRSAEGWGARRVLRVDPFYAGSLWRDWSFARAAREAWRREGFDLVQSHERIPGCDVYRAGDGVHRRWLEIRRETASLLTRVGIFLDPITATSAGRRRRCSSTRACAP
jgi:hypothetical protein